MLFCKKHDLGYQYQLLPNLVQIHLIEQDYSTCDKENHLFDD
jgi:hypothetical protein